MQGKHLYFLWKTVMVGELGCRQGSFNTREICIYYRSMAKALFKYIELEHFCLFKYNKKKDSFKGWVEKREQKSFAKM